MQGDEPIYLTRIGYEKLKKKLERLKKSLPELREELNRTREMGDLSENAAYQIAKHKLRRTDNQILRIEHDLNRIIVIDEGSVDKVSIGSMVEIEIEGELKKFTIVGEKEANPLKGFISNASPLGNALLGLQVKEKFDYKIKDREIKGKVINISSG